MLHVVAVFLVSIIITLFCIFVSHNVGFFDVPDGVLKGHVSPVSYAGGTAVFLTTFLCLGVAAIFNSVFWAPVGCFFLAVAPFFFVGLWDDLFNLSPGIKFLFHVLAGLLFIFSIGGVIFSFLKMAAVLFFVLSVVNSFNLVDVSDGLLGSSVLPFFVLCCFVTSMCGFVFLSLISKVLLGALLGFLVFNWRPARVYLGDGGAFFLAGASLFLLHPFFTMALSPVVILVPILVFGVPLAEVFCLVVLRKKQGLPFYLGSPHHFSHYLKKQGFSVGQTAMFSFLASSVLTCFAASLFLELISVAQTLVCVTAGFAAWVYFVYAPSRPIQRVVLSIRSFFL